MGPEAARVFELRLDGSFKNRWFDESKALGARDAYRSFYPDRDVVLYEGEIVWTKVEL